MNENKIYLTAKELAGMLGVSESQLMDYNDRSAKRRVVPKIVTWDSVQ